jgi:hypothetical protein
MFSQALERYPDHARSLIGLATARARRGEQTSGRAALEHAWRAIDELRAGGRVAEAAMATASAHAVSGRDDDAIAALASLLSEAPPGFAGWTIPIEPLLAGLNAHPAFGVVLSRLAARAS